MFRPVLQSQTAPEWLESIGIVAGSPPRTSAKFRGAGEGAGVAGGKQMESRSTRWGRRLQTVAAAGAKVAGVLALIAALVLTGARGDRELKLGGTLETKRMGLIRIELRLKQYLPRERFAASRPHRRYLALPASSGSVEPMFRPVLQSQTAPEWLA